MAAKLKLIKQGSPASNPPRKLGKHGGQLWRSVIAEYVIEDCSGIEMLAQACAALDRAENCREQIDADGELLRTKNGVRENPLCKIELANRAFLVRTLGRLGLDSEPLKQIGRPPARGFTGYADD
jgi:hypothetical protein